MDMHDNSIFLVANPLDRQMKKRKRKMRRRQEVVAETASLWSSVTYGGHLRLSCLCVSMTAYLLFFFLLRPAEEGLFVCDI